MRGRSKARSTLGGDGGFDAADRAAPPPDRLAQGRDPRTGLPREVKRAAELRSGLSMDDVRVEYNATLPGTVGARAVAKGSRIAVAPGAESSVAHEIWHVAQQKMRRVRADSTRSGFAINTDRALEAEADAFRDDVAGRAGQPGASELVQLRSTAAPALAPLQLNGSEDEYEADDEADDESAGGRKLRKRQKALDRDSNVTDSSSVPPRKTKPRAPKSDTTPVPSTAKRTKRRNEVLASESEASAPIPSSSSSSRTASNASAAAAPRRKGRHRSPVVIDSPSAVLAAGPPLVGAGTAVAEAAKPEAPRTRTPRRRTPPTPKSVLDARAAAKVASTRPALTPPSSAANALANAASYTSPEQFKTPAARAPKSVPMPSAASNAPALDMSLGAAMASALAPSKPAVTAKMAKKKVPVRSKREASAVRADSDEDAASSGDDSESGSLSPRMGTFGASQQGLISKKMGKYYGPPESLKNRRAEQVARHYANLSLNSVAAHQKRSGGSKPVEVQLSAVGNRILINTNNRASSEALVARINAEGGLHKLATQADSQIPAMDPEVARPKRHRSKLIKAQAGERPWQAENAAGESDLDVRRATSILGAAASAGKVGVFDPDNEDAVTAELAKWTDDTAPRVYVVLHSKTGNKNEHAERVQTRFRKKHLKAFESTLSTPPVGPKTTCLGCSAYHEDIAPDLNPHARYSGASFKKGSPIVGSRQTASAMRLIGTRPATGSVSQGGIFRNSDHPDSETDDEGNIAYPKPSSMAAAFGGRTGAQIKWTDRDGATLDAPKAVKTEKIRSRFERARSKSRPKTRPAKIAAPDTPATPLPAASLSMAASAALPVGGGVTVSRAAPTPPLARRTPPKAADRPEHRSIRAIPVPLPPVPKAEPPSRPASGSASQWTGPKPAAPSSHVTQAPLLVKPTAPAPKPPTPVVKPPPAPSALPAASAAPSLLKPLRPPTVRTINGRPGGRIAFSSKQKPPPPSIWDE